MQAETFRFAAFGYGVCRATETSYDALMTDQLQTRHTFSFSRFFKALFSWGSFGWSLVGFLLGNLSLGVYDGITHRNVGQSGAVPVVVWASVGGTVLLGAVIRARRTWPESPVVAARERLRSAEDRLLQDLSGSPAPTAEQVIDEAGQDADGTSDVARDSQGRQDVMASPGDLTRRVGDGFARLLVPDLRLIAEDRLALATLWEVTHARLDLYHQIATSQARRSFITAQAAAAVGFVLLVVFAVLAAQTHTTAGAITTGGLGAVSAALAGYIGRTFVRSQESAAGHLRAYFDQPLEFSKYLAAERLMAGRSDLTSEQRAAIITALVQGILSPVLRPEDLTREKP